MFVPDNLEPTSPGADGDRSGREVTVFSGIPDPTTAVFADLVAFCDEHRDRALAALPWLAAEIADAAGFSALLSLVRARSGQRVYLSASVDEIERKLGVTLPPRRVERIRNMSDNGSTVEVPSAWGVFQCLRRIAVELAVERGEPDDSIARRFGITTRSVRGVRRARAVDR